PPVADEHVRGAVAVATDEVPRIRNERDESPVRADGRKFTAQRRSSRLPAGAADAHPLSGACPSVADEDVRGAVRIASDQVRGRRLEGDEPAVLADHGRPAAVERVPGLGAAAGEADPYGRG